MTFPNIGSRVFTTATRWCRCAALRCICKGSGIDVIQTHDFYTNIFGMAAARLAGVRVRIAARRETTGWRTPAQKIVERQAYRLAHAIVANSEAVRQQLVVEGVADRKIVTVH